MFANAEGRVYGRHPGAESSPLVSSHGAAWARAILLRSWLPGAERAAHLVPECPKLTERHFSLGKSRREELSGAIARAVPVPSRFEELSDVVQVKAEVLRPFYKREVLEDALSVKAVSLRRAAEAR